MREYFQRFARYNRWANARLYEAVGRLTPEAFVAPRSGFFPSLMQTLNHILVADKIWMSRFTDRQHGMKSLNQIIHENFAALRADRETEDNRIIDYVASLDASAFEHMLRFRTLGDGSEVQSELAPTLAHFFNHQTHHRGQAHAMLSSTEVDPPPLDFFHFLREAQ